MPSRTLTLILNGKSASRDDIRAAVTRLRAEGPSIDVFVTWEAGHAARFARELGGIGNSVIVAGGGDGTVNEVLGGLMAAPAPATMAILPLGTANDFATSAGIPIGDPYAALRLAATGASVPVDVGVMNGRYFLNLACGGFGAEVTTSTPIELKNAVGGAAYALMALLLAMKMHPYRGRLIAAGHKYEGSMVMIAVGNGRQAGGGVPLTPQAFIDDGLLDVLVVPDLDRARFMNLLADLVALRHGQSPDFHYLRLREFEIESQDMLQFNLDGEPIRGDRFRFGVLASGIKLILPDRCPLLGSARRNG
jgi:lipid kinase YegS